MKKKKKERFIKGYAGHWNPNRFNIPPGVAWDGADRGNGFEGRYFQAANMKKEKGNDAYKWSTEVRIKFNVFYLIIRTCKQNTSNQYVYIISHLCNR